MGRLHGDDSGFQKKQYAVDPIMRNITYGELFRTAEYLTKRTRQAIWNRQ